MEADGINHGSQVLGPPRVEGAPGISDETQMVLLRIAEAQLAQALDARYHLFKILNAIRGRGHTRHVDGVSTPCFHVLRGFGFGPKSESSGRDAFAKLTMGPSHDVSIGRRAVVLAFPATLTQTRSANTKSIRKPGGYLVDAIQRRGPLIKGFQVLIKRLVRNSGAERNRSAVEVPRGENANFANTPNAYHGTVFSSHLMVGHAINIVDR